MAGVEEPQKVKDQEPPGPVVLAINICDMVIRDELTHKVSLIGLFGVIQAMTFPCKHPLMHIYVALTGGHGKQDMEIRLVRVEDEQPVMAMAGPVVFANPLQVNELNFEWRNVPFERAGEYAVEVCCGKGSAPLGSRMFNVIQVGQAFPTLGSEMG
ncbi:MAG: hypothetical protein ABFE13_01475 [Phycisphaerales bacterium]